MTLYEKVLADMYFAKKVYELKPKKLTKEEQLKQYDAERSRICEMLKQIPFDHFRSKKYVLQLSAVNRNLLASILNTRIEEIDSEMKRLRQEE